MTSLLADENRYVQITQDGTVVSNWVVVSADQITNRANATTEGTCSFVGSSIVFSRAFRDYEDGGVITGDITIAVPPLSLTNVKALSIVKPGLLLKLGVAKNASLPDIVQGGLSPSYAQKYNDLLKNAIARARKSGAADQAVRDDYSDIGGLY